MYRAQVASPLLDKLKECDLSSMNVLNWRINLHTEAAVHSCANCLSYYRVCDPCFHYNTTVTNEAHADFRPQ